MPPTKIYTKTKITIPIVEEIECLNGITWSNFGEEWDKIK